MPTQDRETLRKARMKLPAKKRRAIASMGGQALAKALSPEERSEAARRAAQARWAKAKADQDGDGAAA